MIQFEMCKEGLFGWIYGGANREGGNETEMNRKDK